MHDGQFDKVRAVCLRQSHGLAPAFSTHRVVGQQVSARNPDQAEKSPSAIARPHSSINAIDTQVPIRVRRPGVTHHQLERVAPIPRRQRSFDGLAESVAPNQLICVSFTVHARRPPLPECIWTSELDAPQSRSVRSITDTPKTTHGHVQEPRCLSPPTHTEHQHRRGGDDVDMCERGAGARNNAVGLTPRRCLPTFRQVARRELTSPPRASPSCESRPICRRWAMSAL